MTLLQDPEKPQASDIYAGWGQPDFPRGVTDQRAQGCSHLGRFHSPDLHPWPHRTNPHLTAVKINQTRHNQIIRAVTKCLPVGLPVRGERSDGNEKGSTAEEDTNAGSFTKLKTSTQLYERRRAHPFCQEGPILDLRRLRLMRFPGVRPRSQLEAPTEEGGCWRLAVWSREDLSSGWCCRLLL